MAHAGVQHAMSNYSQRVIEEKEKELRHLVMQNYSRIRDVERELAQLQLQVKLTSGPKKQALELMRKKIEVQNEKVVSIRQRHGIAKQVGAIRPCCPLGRW
jgi:BMFP domain-containing protein YqiC